jgi:DNA adenine methylase Dam
MLRRLGNKTKLLPKLLSLFPEDIKTFIDVFMGSGAVTFAMIPRAKYIVANDNDDEVFNLFMIVKNRKAELVESITKMPIHEHLFKYWKTQQEYDKIWRAARFLLLSNFGVLGKPNTLNCGVGNDKTILLQNIDRVFPLLEHIKFVCCDFREVLEKISFRHPQREKPRVFIYADPPYLGTDNNYQNSFTEKDTEELFELLVTSDMRFAISEFNTPKVLDLAQVYHLNIFEIGERRNINNRRTEILITNYQPIQRQSSLFKGYELTDGRRTWNYLKKQLTD